MTFKHLVRYVGASERWSAWGNPVLAIPLHPVRGHVCRHVQRRAYRHAYSEQTDVQAPCIDIFTGCPTPS